MPIYEYLCESCGRMTELMQKVSDPPPRTCPECGSRKMAKLVSRTAFQLKGGGWYSDLYSSPRRDAKPSGDPSGGGDKGSGAAQGGGEKGSGAAQGAGDKGSGAAAEPGKSSAAGSASATAAGGAGAKEAPGRSKRGSASKRGSDS